MCGRCLVNNLCYCVHINSDNYCVLSSMEVLAHGGKISVRQDLRGGSFSRRKSLREILSPRRWWPMEKNISVRLDLHEGLHGDLLVLSFWLFPFQWFFQANSTASHSHVFLQSIFAEYFMFKVKGHTWIWPWHCTNRPWWEHLPVTTRELYS